MSATAGSTTIEVPLPLRQRIAQHRIHPRQAYHEIIAEAMDLYERRRQGRGLDPLVAKHRRALRQAAKRNRLERIWLFGSRARGDAGPDSDVDILYRAGPGANAWDIATFYADAADILGAKVDVADIDHLDEDVRAMALEDAVVI